MQSPFFSESIFEAQIRSSHLHEYKNSRNSKSLFYAFYLSFCPVQALCYTLVFSLVPFLTEVSKPGFKLLVDGHMLVMKVVDELK